jgi:hypothetical protein
MCFGGSQPTPQAPPPPPPPSSRQQQLSRVEPTKGKSSTWTTA